MTKIRIIWKSREGELIAPAARRSGHAEHEPRARGLSTAMLPGGGPPIASAIERPSPVRRFLEPVRRRRGRSARRCAADRSAKYRLPCPAPRSSPYPSTDILTVTCRRGVVLRRISNRIRKKARRPCDPNGRHEGGTSATKTALRRPQDPPFLACVGGRPPRDPSARPSTRDGRVLARVAAGDRR